MENFSDRRTFPFATGVNDTGMVHLELQLLYLREFSKKFETALLVIGKIMSLGETDS
jgi:hypothetical protein